MKQFCVGFREGVLKQLINIYKYHSVRAVSYELAELLGEILDDDYCLVPLPTIRRHVRQRGFDHVGLMCRRTGLEVEKVLKRCKNTVQVGADNETRQKQAAVAYEAVNVDPERKYLLVDDVWTTGSSMLAACEKMRLAGSKNLAIAVIARSK